MPSIVRVNKPEAILTLFQNGEVDFRDIRPDGSVGPSRPFYEETVKDIFKYIKPKENKRRLKQINGLIPEKLLYMNNERDVYVWKHKACVKKLYHTNKEFTGKYALPNLVFKLDKDRLYVVAVKSYTKDPKLYKAPFTNITGSSMCMGSAEIKYQNFTDVEELIIHAETAFFKSKFSHAVGEYMLNGKDQKYYPIEKLTLYTKMSFKTFINA